MAPDLAAQAAAAWPGVPAVSVLDLPEEKEVVVLGTLYKEQALKPSALDDFVANQPGGTGRSAGTTGVDGGTGSGEAGAVAAGLEALIGVPRLAGPGDSLVLEDAGARVALTGLDPSPLVTGVVAALRGKVGAGGEFEVSAALFRGPGTTGGPPPLPSPPPPPPPEGDTYLALLSGIGMGDPTGKAAHAAALAVDLLAGLAGCGPDGALWSRVARAVVAGGLLRSSDGLAVIRASTGADAAPASVAASARAALAPLRDADAAVAGLAAALPVDVMPGAPDPTNAALPQQPLHACLLPGASGFGPSACVRATNPHEFECGGVRFLGSAGQNVADVARYSTAPTRLACLERLLAWGHLAPTAPDTLPAYPFKDRDPFVLQGAPHVLFAGGAAVFETGVVEVAGGEGGGPPRAVRLVSVPEFAATGIVVLVNLRTLECHPVRVAVE
jgi:DNA polymerase delta subunit 2